MLLFATNVLCGSPISCYIKKDKNLMEQNVIIADGSPAFAEGLGMIIRRSPHHILSGVFSQVHEALLQIKMHEPKLVIVDKNIPSQGGMFLIKKIQEMNLFPRIILISDSFEEVLFQEGVSLDVHAFLLKQSSLQEINDCIQSVSYSDLFLCERCDISHEEYPAPLESQYDTLNLLSRTEAKILALIAREKSTRQIADLLYRSEKTIENHRGNICKKLQVSGRNALLKYALAHSQVLLRHFQQV